MSSGENTPASIAEKFCLEAAKQSRSPRFALPPITRRYTMTPAWFEYLKSKTSARKSAEDSSGAGMRSTTARSSSGTPSPVFPETKSTSLSGRPQSFATSLLVSGTRASGESILFTAGTIARFASRAIESTEMVCACTPCVASTSTTAPSTALSARETS